jgi:serine/threonine protein phosphatase PrpC
VRYQIARHTLRGARKRNEDRVAFFERANAVLMVLGDGLGGYEGGAIAAEILVRTAEHAFAAVKQPLIAKPSAFLALMLIQAHKAILAYGRAATPPISPRTTAVLCLVQEGFAYWAHVGDSRLYHFRDGQLRTRTLDDTKVEQLHVDGVLSEAEMRSHPEKSKLLRCLGSINSEPSIALGEETPLQRGDTLLLCSDGLWQAFTPEALTAYLRAAALEEGIDALVLSAVQRMNKASDNVSAVCLRWEDEVTRRPPLQPHGIPRADQRLLWERAQQKTARDKARMRAEPPPTPKPPPAASAAKKTDDMTLEELEAWLVQRDPSRAKPKVD